MAIYRTGRTRTLALNGSIFGTYAITRYIKDGLPVPHVRCIEEPHYEFDLPNATDAFTYNLTVMGTGLNWGLSVTPDTNLPNWDACATGELKERHPAMVTITLRGESDELDLSEYFDVPGSISIGIVGTWEYSVQLEEFIEFPFALGPEVVDDLGFFIEGSSARHRLTARGARYFERPIVGTSESLSFVGPSGSLGLSHEIEEGDGFGYDVEIAGNTTQVELGGTFGATFAQGAGTTYTRSISYTGGEAQCNGTSTGISLDIDADAPDQCSMSATIGHTQTFTLIARLRSLGTTGTVPYPGDVTIGWITHKDEEGEDALTVVPVSGGSASSSYTQRYYAYDCELCGSPQTGESKNERTHSRANVNGLSDNGDDARDNHLPFQIYPWEALRLAHASSRTVSSTDTLTDGDNSLALTESNWEGHRYLSVPYTFGDDRTLTLVVGGKEFDLPVTAGTGTAVIDLCRPSNLPAGEVWTRDGRWPLASGPTSDPDEFSMGDPEKGWTFGILSRPTSVTVNGLLEEESLAIGPLSLVRQDSARARVLIAFMNEQRVWESPSDTTYGDFDLSLLADGKQCGPVCGRFRVQGESSESYSWTSIQDVSDFIDGLIKGWNATAVAAPSYSPEEEDDDTLKLLSPDREFQYCDPYLWDGSNWRDQTHLDCSGEGSIWAALYAHEVTIYPGIGDPMDFDRSEGGAFPLRCSAVYRSQAEGICFATEGAASAGIGVRLVTWLAEVSAGGATSAARGIYRTGSPFAKGNGTHRTRLAKDTSKYEEWAPQNRYVGRTDFFGVGETGRCFLRIHPDLRRALGFIAGGTLWLWFFDVGQQSADLSADARDTEVSAEWCAGAWKPAGGMFLLLGDGGNAKLYSLDTEGGTPTLASDLGAATSGDIFSTDDVTFRAYRLDGGTLKCHVLDVAGNEISAFDTNLTDLDEEFIACDQSVAERNGVQVALTAVQGGTRKVFLSSDGRNFS